AGVRERDAPTFPRLLSSLCSGAQAGLQAPTSTRRDAIALHPHPTPAAQGQLTRLAAALAVAAVAAFAFPLTAAARSHPSALTARRGITQALRHGWIKGADANAYRGDVSLAEQAIAKLPPLRARILRVQLGQVAAFSGSYISPRALALFSQLRENVD